MGGDDNNRKVALVRTEKCVLVSLNADPLPNEFWPLNDKLYEVMDSSNVGEFDGNEIGGGKATLFFYGQDANQILRIVGPIFREHPACRNARIVVRKGPPESSETEIQL